MKHKLITHKKDPQLLELARTFGLNIPGKRPSITIVDWTVENIPVKW